jgi:ABC-2 type transport system permease protein
MTEVAAILTISYRDVLRFLRDRVRIAATLVFPLVFIGILGGSFEANLEATYSFFTFVFTGVYAQNLFQSAAGGLISLIEDRENDFSQEIFVAPISRYSIVFGKILGETLVALAQGIAIILFGLVLGLPLSPPQILALLATGIVACLLGGAFGVVVLGNIGSQRAANQIFPFIIFPQFFLAGVFAPIKNLPPYLDILSRLSPMRYAIDLTRGLYYAGTDDYSEVVLASPLYNLGVIGVLFAVFLIVGTYLFVRRERNR